jgi:hypothetical protein
MAGSGLKASLDGPEYAEKRRYFNEAESKEAGETKRRGFKRLN